METKTPIRDLTPKQKKRNQLKALSKTAKMMIQAHVTEYEKVNEVLINDFYTDDENYIFHTFHGWMKIGYKVKKGEKAYLIWGRKRKVKPQDNLPDEETQEYKFFPICYVFSNAQVEPLKKDI